MFHSLLRPRLLSRLAVLVLMLCLSVVTLTPQSAAQAASEGNLAPDLAGNGRLVGGTADGVAYRQACPSFPLTVPPSDAASLIFAITCANSNGANTNDTI